MEKKKEIKDPELKRIHRKSMMLNTKEFKVFEQYCTRYKVSNKSQFMRESIVNSILKRMDEDAPTLFEVPKAKATPKMVVTHHAPKQVIHESPKLFDCVQLDLFASAAL